MVLRGPEVTRRVTPAGRAEIGRLNGVRGDELPTRLDCREYQQRYGISQNGTFGAFAGGKGVLPTGIESGQSF